jgi:hypothetical protein
MEAIQSWSETKFTNESGRTTGHFCLAVALGVAVLESGRSIVCSTRGEAKGVVRLQPQPALKVVELFIAGTHLLQLHAEEHREEAVRHFIALVGERAAFKAIKQAAASHELADGSHSPFTAECVVAERPNRHGDGTDRLSFGLFCGSGRKFEWRFIQRYSVDERGGTTRGADLCPVGESLEKRVAQFLAPAN